MATPPSLELAKDLAGIVQTIVQTAAVGVAGWWAYRKFVRRREDFPHVEFTVSIIVLGREQDQLLVELTATIENKGSVRHEMTDVSFDLRCVLRGERLELGDARINHQVLFGQVVQQGSWIPTSWESTFIEPQTRQRYSFIAQAPRSASFLLLHGRFKYSAPGEFHTADCVVPVT